MAARYDFREVPSKKENGEEPKLYPHIISSGTIRTRTILEEISEASTFTVGDLEGVLCALTEKSPNIWWTDTMWSWARSAISRQA